MGIATGGIDYGKGRQESEQNFGGGGGTGLAITPIAFLTVGRDAEVNLIHINGGAADVNVYCDKIEIILADRGPGIPDIEKAMEAGFSTAPDDIRSLGFGAGMGLPNMKKYTDSINIETEVGVGTTVTMVVNV